MSEHRPERHELLARFEREVRRPGPALAEGRPFTIDGPLVRARFSAAAVVQGPPDLGVDGPELERLIERQVQASADDGVPLEWKTYADDRPASLVPLLLAAGFEPEPVEAVMVAPSDVLAAVTAPADVDVREVDDAEFPRVVELLTEVWNADHDWLLAEFAVLRGLLGRGLRVLAVERAGAIASVAWLVMHPGTSFAGLWGGSTAEADRGRGYYRALVIARARIAAEAGVPFLRVDAAPTSRPILEGLGFDQLTTTTPYVWAP